MLTARVVRNRPKYSILSKYFSIRQRQAQDYTLITNDVPPSISQIKPFKIIEGFIIKMPLQLQKQQQAFVNINHICRGCFLRNCFQKVPYHQVKKSTFVILANSLLLTLALL